MTTLSIALQGVGRGPLALATQGFRGGVQAVALPGSGLLTFGGLAPAVSIDYRALVGSGIVSIGGLAPSARVDLFTAPNAGLLTFGGLAPGVSLGAFAPLGAGILTISGYAPQVFSRPRPTPAWRISFVSAENRLVGVMPEGRFSPQVNPESRLASILEDGRGGSVYPERRMTHVRA